MAVLLLCTHSTSDVDNIPPPMFPTLILAQMQNQLLQSKMAFSQQKQLSAKHKTTTASKKQPISRQKVITTSKVIVNKSLNLNTMETDYMLLVKKLRSNLYEEIVALPMLRAIQLTNVTVSSLSRLGMLSQLVWCMLHAR
jgi:hypothetical protein